MPSEDTPLYPLKFEPIYKEKVWGGRALEMLGRKLPGDANTRIGESWELTDLSASSPSGGGGGSERSIVRNGPFQGTTLHDLIERYGQKLLGRLPLDASGNFPFLFKFLDLQENVSVQVHPTPAYVRDYPDAHVKHEAWYVVDAAPGAVIYKGIHEGVTLQQFRDAIASGQAEAVEALLIKVPAKPGDCHYLPSGTCHAGGSGVLSAEVQTASDTTFRVFDWGRIDRELHIEQGMQCIDFGPPDVKGYEKRSPIADRFTDATRMVVCEYFCIDQVHAAENDAQDSPYDQPAVWMVLEGAGQIDPGNGVGQVGFSRGETLFIPAGLENAHVEFNQDTIWLEVTFPQTSLKNPLKGC